MKPKHADDGMNCPWYRKPCIKVCHTCEMWERIQGKHPQSGLDMDVWACTVKLQTLLQIEQIKETRTASASVDHLRKEVQTGNDSAMVGTLARLNEKIDHQSGMAQIGGISPKLIGSA